MNSGEVNDTLSEILDVVINVALSFTGIFLVIRIGWMFIDGMITGIAVDLKKIAGGGLIHGILIIFLLSVYQPLIGLVEGTFYGIVTELQSEINVDNVSRYNKITAQLKASLKEAQENEEDEAWFDGRIGEFLGLKVMNFYENNELSVMGIVQTVTRFLASIMGFIIMLISVVQVKLLKIVGPLSLVFTLIPMFRSSFSKWLNGFVNGFAAMIFILLLEAAANGFASFIDVAANRSLEVDVRFFVFMDLGIIIMYLSAFKFASYIIGEDVGSTVLDNGMKLVNIASNVVTAASSTFAASKGVAGNASENGASEMSNIK